MAANRTQMCSDDWGIIENAAALYSFCVISNINIAYRIVVMPILLILGLFGQSSSIIIFLKLNKWKSTCKVYYLTSAIMDLAFLFAFGIPEWTGEGLDYVTFGSLNFTPENYSILSCRVFRFTWSVTSFVSYWVLLVFSVERALAIAYPFLRMKFINIRIAIINCSIVTIFGIIIFSPTIFTDVYKLWGVEENVPIESRYCYTNIPEISPLLLIWLFLTTLLLMFCLRFCLLLAT